MEEARPHYTIRLDDVLRDARVGIDNGVPDPKRSRSAPACIGTRHLAERAAHEDLLHHVALKHRDRPLEPFRPIGAIDTATSKELREADRLALCIALVDHRANRMIRGEDISTV